ncbi:DNA phosphorothioation-dependent restriction protein DptF [Cohnella sp. GCM10027633]|uniref:DNA phosphorothioation-dependent restriction protein DptF n=1 Tax=unclassified Cohnella TaxID=2636738 RepID=UPI003624CFC4
MNGKYLQFIGELSPKGANHAQGMEQILFQEPGAALVKARNFLEEIIKEIFKIEELKDQEQLYKSLFDRIGYLSSNGYLTPPVQFAMHSLRTLGNKGAHEAVSDLEGPIKAHKLMYELAKWFYEIYSTSSQNEIPDYHFPKPQIDLDNLKSDLKEYVEKLLGDHSNKGSIKQLIEPQNEDRNIDIHALPIQLDLNNGESYLLRELKRLQDSSKEAIESANAFTAFKEYLHVERKVQRDFVELLKNKQNNTNSNLVLICGSVGDGKSHLLAYIQSHHSELLQHYSIINDATESYSPNMNALDTLKLSLKDFSDDRISQSGKKTLLAINLGVLHNFIQADEDNQFSSLRQFVYNSELFSQRKIQRLSADNFDLICIGDYQSYELSVNGTQSEFFSGLVTKVFGEQAENPFHLAYQEDLKNGNYTATHFNYEFMRDQQVQQTVVNLVIECMIKFKLVISARSFLNFLVDVLVIDNLNTYRMLNEFEKINSSVPMLLFNRPDRSFILRHMAMLNPYTTQRLRQVDQLIIELNMLEDNEDVVTNHVTNARGLELLSVLMKDKELAHEPFLIFAEAVVLTAYLSNQEFSNSVGDPIYNSYIYRLYGYNTSNMQIIKGLYQSVKDAVFDWKGSPRKDYIYLSNDQTKFRLAQELNFRPSLVHLPKEKGALLENFSDKMIVSYELGTNNGTANLEIDFQLYRLLSQINNGYVPNKQDQEDSIKFIEFIEKLMGIGMKNKKLLIHLESENKIFFLSKDEFQGYLFEKEGAN